MTDEHAHPAAAGPEPPVILLTCGDPAGIGPEIVARAWEATSLHRQARLRVVADAGHLAALLAARPALPRLPVTVVSPDDRRDSTGSELLVIDSCTRPGGHTDAVAPPLGVVSAAGGRAAAAAVEAAFHLVRRGAGQAIVTGPLHKESLHAAGYDMPGHTELLARLCGLPDEAASMMLWLPATEPGRSGLGVVHVTLHESLRSAVARLSTTGIVDAGRRLADLLRALLGRPPRIAVAALNPHGGEGGLFGDEEARIVVPAVGRLAAAGIDVTGPVPADTLFLRASRGAFDGVVALYHDQGHIPIKLLGMHRAVNVTLGLPLVRTSVAHGTAFDIVGRGVADPASMLAALDVARRLVTGGWPAGVRAASAPSLPRTRR
jgi:4-hydroxythreonine-4-phosphate dehydrogenase